ncbi:MAG TPA: hypothetical protein VLF79_02535 [Candidatus Saccharimonadales bacterium]|nr:hypothetical protein [Candidatus Saccharimonadales bacterium]
MTERLVPIKPESQCIGGLALEECETVRTQLKNAAVGDIGSAGLDFVLWSRRVYLDQICNDCGNKCSVEIQTEKGERTGEYRLVFSGLEPTPQTLRNQ